jgi:hypothetical protein
MRADRFGSYSTVAMRAGTPGLSRFQSMSRYSRLWPEPWWRTVSLPWLLRPARRTSRSVSGLCGWSVVTSSNVARVIWRRPGLVGR